jgi:hypothetical protein
MNYKNRLIYIFSIFVLLLLLSILWFNYKNQNFVECCTYFLIIPVVYFGISTFKSNLLANQTILFFILGLIIPCFLKRTPNYFLSVCEGISIILGGCLTWIIRNIIDKYANKNH